MDSKRHQSWYYVKALRDYLTCNALDAIVIYANAYDDRFMKALVGTYSILQNYILVSRSHIYISEARYLVHDLKKRAVSHAILPAEGEHVVIDPIIKLLGKKKRIGIAGNCRYTDILQLQPSITVDLTQKTNELIMYKSDLYIRTLTQYAQKLAAVLETTTITPGTSQKDIAKALQTRIIQAEYNLSFPISIVSGNDLSKTTAALPTDKKISNSDQLCIDMGLQHNLYTTDMTRMIFLKNAGAKHLYLMIQKKHTAILKSISPKQSFGTLVSMYKKEIGSLADVYSVENNDFGHGIGFSLHEYPNIESVPERIIGTNIVFTVEPTIQTKYGLMRVEDMIGIDSKGYVSILTDRSCHMSAQLIQ